MDQEVHLHFADRLPCPCMGLLDFLAVRVSSHTLLLDHEDDTPLTRYQFSALFQGVLVALGSSSGGCASVHIHLGMGWHQLRRLPD